MERPTSLPERRSQSSTSSESGANFINFATRSINTYEPSGESPESKVQCRDTTNMTELAQRGTYDRWSLL